MTSKNASNLRKLAVILAATAAAVAQTQTATVRGTVTDSSGGVLPRATLSLINVDQNRPWKAITNDAGEYVFVQIPPGNYTLQVEARGFKKIEREVFPLEVAQVLGLDIRMEVGNLTETVQIHAQAPLLDTATSSLGEVVNSRTSESLPLNGRNVLQLIGLTPGINITPGYRAQTDSNGTTNGPAFSANGGRNLANTILVDGSPQEVMGYNQPAFIPNPDTVQEFKVQTNNLAAEYGRTGGAVVNAVTRSGTKEFHGALFEFLRNDALDANGFFNNRNGSPKAAFRYNQFGGTVGGPLTPSRERAFFFFSYEGMRQVIPGSLTATVPTAAMRRGDFSQASQVIYDPLTVDAAGVRQPFAGRQIPVSRQNPAGLKIMGFYPEPTTPGLGNNFFAQASTAPRNNIYNIRIDHRFSDRHNIFGRVSWNDYMGQLGGDFYNSAGSPLIGIDGRSNRSATLDDNYTTGGWVLHVNLGYAFNALPRAAPEGITAVSLSMPAAIDSVSQFKIFPRFDPAGYAVLGADPTFYNGNKFETYTGTADAMTLHGRHSIKFGGTYRLNKVSNFRTNAPAGQYSFDDTWTRQNLTRAGGGDTMASMLLGLPASGRIQSEPNLALTVPYIAFFVQDDWRATDRLTLNLGLRWESDRPMTERFNRTSSFDPDAVFPVQAPGLGSLHGGLVFAGRDGRPRGNRDPDNNNFAPRIGVAYKLSERLVLRSGFGMFYNPTTGTGPAAANVGALSYNAVTPVVASIDGGRTPYATLSNPFPDGFQTAENGAKGLLTFAGQGMSAILRGEPMPYSMQWNFNVQYELEQNMLLDVAYAGNAGVKLQAGNEMNQLPDQYLSLREQLNAVVANPFAGIFPATTALGAATTTRGQLLRPYPQFTGVQQIWGSQAHSTYHALQAKFRKRYRGGLQLLAAYTWSKNLDDISSVAGFLGEQNPGYTNTNQKRLDKSLSAGDVAHRLVTNFEYELPFGKGKPMLSRGPAGGIAGNWSVNGVVSLQSGLPISISSRQNTTSSYGGVQRPNSTGLKSQTEGGKKERINGWFNNAAFVDAPTFTFGNVGRLLPDNRGPYFHNWDLSILKNIPIRERFRLQFRMELFNAFNMVNFANPSGLIFGRPEFGSITSSEPGRIIQFGLKLHY